MVTLKNCIAGRGAIIIVGRREEGDNRPYDVSVLRGGLFPRDGIREEVRSNWVISVS